MRNAMRWVVMAGLVLGMAACAGCANIAEQPMPDCSELGRDTITALLGVEMPAGCDRVPSAQDYVMWRAIGGEVFGGSTTCIYRSGGAPGLLAEVVTIDSVPVDASVTAPPRTTRTCTAVVSEVCMPTGDCTVLE